MWIERTTYVTAYGFPGILKWFEVKSVSVVRDTERDASWWHRGQPRAPWSRPLCLGAGGGESAAERCGDHGEDQREAQQPGAAAGLRPLAVRQSAIHDAQRHRRPRRHGWLQQLREGWWFSFQRADGSGTSCPSPAPPQAFFTDSYIQEHPEDQERIELLKHLIALQVKPLPLCSLPSGVTLSPPPDPAPG